MSIGSKSGQLILEILLAIGITAMVLVGLLAAVVRATKNTDNANQISLASSYAEEGIEMARKERDRADTWGEFTSRFSGPKGLESDLSWNGCTSPNIGAFTRCVDFDNSGDKSVVTATVSWEESGRSQQVEAVTFLTKWSR